MENLNLFSRTPITLRNKSTLQYMHFVESSENPFQTVDAYGTPPSIHTQDQRDDTTQLKIVIFGKVNQQQQLFYGTKVHLVTNNNQYLASLADGGLKFDKLGLQEGQNKALMSTSAWILTDRNNNIIKKPITIYDDVVLKSVYSTFLSCQEDGWVTARTNTISLSAVWNIMKANVPYIPDWMYLRPTLSKNMTMSLDKQQIRKDDRKPLSSFDIQVQQWLLIEDILDIMLGFEGVYIKWRGDKTNFVIESQYQSATCDISIAQLCQKILVVPTNQYLIQNYVSINSVDNGVVAQAFSGALRLLLKQYKKMVISLDSEADQKGITLQMMWSYIQPAASVVSCLVQLIRAAGKLKGGPLLSCIYNFMMSANDPMINSIYRTLFTKTITVYIQELQNWIYNGTIVDKHKQFMIQKNQLQNDKRINEWNQRFVLNKNMVPVFLNKEAQLILKTGKYLNVIAECDRSSQNPHKFELSRNIQKYLQNNDFSQPIHNAYKWVSEQLKSFMFKDKGLTNVLQSLKGFFLLDYGDVYTSFLQAAQSQLGQPRSKNVSTEKLESLLQLSIKTSTAKNDIFNQDIFCKVENMTIFQQVNSIKRLEQKNFNFDPSYKPPGQNPAFKYFEAFTIDCKVQFPLNLIINFKCINKYQVLFRHFFWFKYIEKCLNDTWQTLQSLRQYQITCLMKGHLLIQKMIHYCRSMMYYLFYEVIEKNWTILMENLKKVVTFEDIMVYHDQFLDKCLKESMITNQKLLKVIVSDLGNTIQGFLIIKAYIISLTSDITSNFLDRKYSQQQNKMQKIRSRKQYIKNSKESISQSIQNQKLKHFIEGFVLSFDKGMKQLLEDLYRVLSKDKDRESMENIIYLLPRLDTHDYYDKRLQMHKNQRKI